MRWPAVFSMGKATMVKPEYLESAVRLEHEAAKV
jgi:hypothetical protein